MASEIQSKNWKLKYRELVHELETKEVQWTQIEQVLRTAVSRLALAAMGQNTNLDNTLERIRNHSKKEAAIHEMERDVAVLSKVLTRMELAQPPTQTQPEPEPTDWFLDLLFEAKQNLDNSEALNGLISDMQQGKLSMDVAVKRFSKLIPKPAAARPPSNTSEQRVHT